MSKKLYSFASVLWCMFCVYVLRSLFLFIFELTFIYRNHVMLYLLMIKSECLLSKKVFCWCKDMSSVTSSTIKSTFPIIYIRGSLNRFPDFFFVWALLLIVHTWNFSPLRSNLLWLQFTCCTVPTTSGRPIESPFVWACQWPLSQPLSSPQLSHNDSLWA